MIQKRDEPKKRKRHKKHSGIMPNQPCLLNTLILYSNFAEIFTCVLLLLIMMNLLHELKTSLRARDFLTYFAGQRFVLRTL